MPRRMRALIVPKGSCNVSAISKWVSPPKNAISMTTRWSAGRPRTVERISTNSSASNPAAGLSSSKNDPDWKKVSVLAPLQ